MCGPLFLQVNYAESDPAEKPSAECLVMQTL